VSSTGSDVYFLIVVRLSRVSEIFVIFYVVEYNTK
jgi:hypothetical protein